MNWTVLVVGQLATNCYLVWDNEGHGVVIDPGDEAERLVAEAAQRGVTVEAVLLTHLHIDHFLGLPTLLSHTGARLVLPREELPAVNEPSRSLMSWLPPEARFSLPRPDETVGEGDTVTVGSLVFTVWHTPGHTAGSSCYACEEVLFCGDTLFVGSVGRCDLPSGDAVALQNTLRRLSQITTPYRLLPGHGASGWLAEEQQSNPFMK